MLADVDLSLRAWLSAVLPAGIAVEFGPPVEKPQRRPMVNLFLYAVEEDTSGLAANDIRVRDEHGRLSTAILPSRRYAMTYQVTAWAATVLDEHQLLGSVLLAHASNEALGNDHLHGSLRGLDLHVPIYIGTAHRPAVWDNLGPAMRTGLELTVLAPAIPPRRRVTAPSPENLDLTARALPSPKTLATDEPPRRWKRTSITEPTVPDSPATHPRTPPPHTPAQRVPNSPATPALGGPDEP